MSATFECCSKMVCMGSCWETTVGGGCCCDGGVTVVVGKGGSELCSMMCSPMQPALVTGPPCMICVAVAGCFMTCRRDMCVVALCACRNVCGPGSALSCNMRTAGWCMKSVLIALS